MTDTDNDTITRKPEKVVIHDKRKICINWSTRTVLWKCSSDIEFSSHSENAILSKQYRSKGSDQYMTHRVYDREDHEQSQYCDISSHDAQTHTSDKHKSQQHEMTMNKSYSDY